MAVSNILTKTDPRGGYYTTIFKYDAQNNIIEEDAPQGDSAHPQPAAVTQRQYDADGNLIAAYDPRNPVWVTSYAYDAAGRMISITHPEGSEVGPAMPDATETFTYDAVGDLLSHTDLLGYVTTYTYDSRNRVATTTDALGNVTKYGYDALGDVTTFEEDDQATGRKRITTYTYDGLGRKLTESIDGLLTTHYTYDATGNLLQAVGPLSGANGSAFTTSSTFLRWPRPHPDHDLTRMATRRPLSTMRRDT